MTIENYLTHYDCHDCKLSKWAYNWCECPLLEKEFEDDGKVRTTQRSDCPIKKYRRKSRMEEETKKINEELEKGHYSSWMDAWWDLYGKTKVEGCFDVYPSISDVKFHVDKDGNTVIDDFKFREVGVYDQRRKAQATRY